MTDKPPLETIYDFLFRKRGEAWTTANTQWVTDQLLKIESTAIGLAEMRYREGLSDSDLGEYLKRQWKWSAETFGPGKRTKGTLSHIRKELQEIEQAPNDLEEWIDVVLLALDGFWRAGGKVEDVIPHLKAKQAKNGAREWPAWKPEDEPVEHLLETMSLGDFHAFVHCGHTSFPNTCKCGCFRNSATHIPETTAQFTCPPP